jgi:hypothetical protein
LHPRRGQTKETLTIPEKEFNVLATSNVLGVDRTNYAEKNPRNELYAFKPDKLLACKADNHTTSLAINDTNSPQKKETRSHLKKALLSGEI